MTDAVISKEVARGQLEMLLGYYDLDAGDFENDTMKDLFETACNKLVKAISKGRLEIKEDEGLKITQHLRTGDELVYAEICGKHKTAMAGKKDGDQYGKIYALLGSMSGVGETGISKLTGVDISVAECLGFLYMQV